MWFTVSKNKAFYDLHMPAIVHSRQSTPGKLSKNEKITYETFLKLTSPLFATSERSSLFREAPFMALSVATYNVHCAKASCASTRGNKIVRQGNIRYK